MIWLSWRQFRIQGLVAVGLLVVAAALLAGTGPHLAHIYATYAKAQAACLASTTCGHVDVNPGQLDRLLELFGAALVALPGLIGAFWGAPMISRELEHGTHRLVWTQSVTRTRWLATKLALVGTASVLSTGLLSLMVTWWSSPIDRANMNRFDSGLFGERNVTPLGYAALGFAVGVAAGLFIRRTLPAMASALAVFLGARLGFTYGIRQHLLTPKHISQPLSAVVHGFGRSNNGPPTLFADAANLPNAWIYSTRIVDGAGHPLSAHTVATACPALLNPPDPGPLGSGTVRAVPGVGVRDSLLQTCIDKLGPTYHSVTTYQPASRYWVLQWYETGIFFATAIVLAALCFYAIRRRAY